MRNYVAAIVRNEPRIRKQTITMSLREWSVRIGQVINPNPTPEHERHPSHYHVCPACGVMPPNAKWSLWVSWVDEPADDPPGDICYICPACETMISADTYRQQRLDRLKNGQENP